MVFAGKGVFDILLPQNSLLLPSNANVCDANTCCIIPQTPKKFCGWVCAGWWVTCPPTTPLYINGEI